MATSREKVDRNQTLRLEDVELDVTPDERDPKAQVAAATPLTPGTPGAGDVVARDSVIVYFALDPGRYLPTHIDSEEEILVCMSGAVTVIVDGEEATLSAGELAVVPKKAPHGVRNDGNERATVLGFFPAGEVHHEFGEEHFVTKPKVGDA